MGVRSAAWFNSLFDCECAYLIVLQRELNSVGWVVEALPFVAKSFRHRLAVNEQGGFSDAMRLQGLRCPDLAVSEVFCRLAKFQNNLVTSNAPAVCERQTAGQLS